MFRWALAILIFAPLATDCAAPVRVEAASPPKSAAAQGRDFVQRACAGCHAVGRSGESPNPNSPSFRDLARTYGDAQLAETLRSISRNGHVEMPPIYMTPREQGEVVAYLRTLTGRAI